MPEPLTQSAGAVAAFLTLVLSAADLHAGLADAKVAADRSIDSSSVKIPGCA